jgi:hypothetical protein
VGTRVDPHSDHSQPALSAGNPRQSHQFCDAQCGRVAIKNGIANRHDDSVCRHHDLGQLKPMHASRRIQNDVGYTCRWSEYASVVGDPWQDVGQRWIAPLEPGARGLLTIHIAQHDRQALPGQPRCQVGGECAFATTAFVIDDRDHWHENHHSRS